MPKFRKKPVEIEAMQLTADSYIAVVDWLNRHAAAANGILYKEKASEASSFIIIHTLEGDHKAQIGDWVIKGIKGEFYPCKPDIFEATYELQED